MKYDLQKGSIMKYSLAHIGLNVVNLERSIKFYEEAFGLHEIFRMRPKSDLDITLCFMGDDRCGCLITLILYGQHDEKEPFDVGEDNIGLNFITDDFEASLKKHREMGIVTMESTNGRIYYVQDPDGYEISVVPEKFHPIRLAR
ncbi:MAG: VOC family protein [Bilifractor sp.]